MWSRLRFFTRSRAALFWTLCSRPVCSSGRPASHCGNQGRMLSKRRQVFSKCLSKHTDGRTQVVLMQQQRCDKCYQSDPAWRVWPVLTPTYFTDVVKGIVLPPMSADLVYRPQTTWSATSMSLVLFVDSKISPIHVWMHDWTERNLSHLFFIYFHFFFFFFFHFSFFFFFFFFFHFFIQCGEY